MRKGYILFMAVVLLAGLVIGCLSTDGQQAEQSTTEVKVAPSGMARFSPEAIAEWGCPEQDKIPWWVSIPECENTDD